MIKNADAFIVWLGHELDILLRTTDVSNRFSAARDLVTHAMQTLPAMTSSERKRVRDLLGASHQSRFIGGFKIPWDVRDDNDCIEEIIASIEGLLV